MLATRLVAIEFWHGFIDYNYLSLNRQLIPITITKFASGTSKESPLGSTCMYQRYTHRPQQPSTREKMRLMF